MTWQPIETAPRCVEVIVFAPSENPAVSTAELDAREWTYSRAGQYAPIDDFYGDGPLHPTHWMPLPEPPTPSKTVRDE